MNLAKRIFGSSVGKKYIMAVTGFFLFIFVLGHMLGNLQIFQGREVINTYGGLLHFSKVLLWSVRVMMLILVTLHVTMAVQLASENKRARGLPYAYQDLAAASYASRTMLMSGLIVACFVIFHLLHFTLQVEAVNLVGVDFSELRDARGRLDVFGMEVLAFSKPLVSGFYLLGVGLVSLHLSHGLSSMFQSVGFRREPYRIWLDRLAALVGWVIFLGYASMPVAIMMGYGKD